MHYHGIKRGRRILRGVRKEYNLQIKRWGRKEIKVKEGRDNFRI